MRNMIIKITLIIFIASGLGALPLYAVEPPRIQILNKTLQPHESHYYNFNKLKKGDMIYIKMERLSGNLDPLVGITKDKTDFISFEEFYNKKLPNLLEDQFDFTEVFPKYADDFFLLWDDNSGNLSDATITYEVTEEGDYQLLVTGSYYQLRRDDKYYNTFGQYRLSVGVNAPEVLDKEYLSTGHTVVSQLGKFHRRVQEISEEISKDRKYIEFPLNTLDKSDTLYVYVEKTSGNLKPTVKLRDYGNRLLSFDNISGEDQNAAFEYKLKEEAENYTLVIRGDSEGEEDTMGEFRLLIGTNAPEVLSGNADQRGRSIIREPIEVEVSLLIDQITGIDQRRENFTIVAYLLLDWVDPSFAYNTSECKCNFIDYSSQQFDDYLVENNLETPRFIILNQQGRRFIQEDNYRIYPDGSIRFFERFTVTLQAPDFDFRKFPFDPQTFYIKLLMLRSLDHYIFKVNPEWPSIGNKLGEEEWQIYDHKAFVDFKKLNNVFSAYTLQIEAKRHIDYYMFRIFIPLLLIVIVSWGTLFMRDYSNRISVSVAVLLIFVAFNFTIGSDLPRLGYMTFMDGIMFAAFLVTALVVLLNVFLRRLETTDHVEFAYSFDRFTTILYPILYIGILAVLVWIFFYLS